MARTEYLIYYSQDYKLLRHRGVSFKFELETKLLAFKKLLFNVFFIKPSTDEQHCVTKSNKFAILVNLYILYFV